jgi:hypothetical protein
MRYTFSQFIWPAENLRLLSGAELVHTVFSHYTLSASRSDASTSGLDSRVVATAVALAVVVLPRADRRL